MAHRDFVPWNTCLSPRGLFIFDWESASDGAPPLYDAFHFHAIQPALFKENYQPDFSLFARWLDVFWPRNQVHLPGLYLAYLVDMSLYFTEARVRAPDVGEQYLWNWFGSQLDQYLQQEKGFG